MGSFNFNPIRELGFIIIIQEKDSYCFLTNIYITTKLHIMYMLVFLGVDQFLFHFDNV